jgi:hypothetical protein
MNLGSHFAFSSAIVFAGSLTVAVAQNPTPSPTPTPANPVPNSATPAAGKISDVETKDGRWDCSLPGGNFTVALGHIHAVSIHQYVVSTPTPTASPVPLPTRVHEANLAMNGGMQVRFYFVESATEASALNVTKTALERANQLANEAASRTGTMKVWQMVQKDYPVATHANSVEFRVNSLADLTRLYGSLKRSWITGKGAQFSIAE